jgi:hypothetical protein
MKDIRPFLSIYAKAFTTLQRICRRANLLPVACTLIGPITLETSQSLHQTNYSDVYRGFHDGMLVALKSLRIHGDDRARIEKVSHYP